ncbi:TetR/AcrR family transcriptional regulator [Sphingobium herbicidovorans]|nr:TetR/AcrR family transcriptional regulator [Sphingobium herbicidovorans]
MAGAARVFEQRGYQGTTLNDIAREVGCSKVTIYNYFKSREDLLKAIIVEGARPTMDHLRAQLAGEGALIDRLRAFGRTYLILVMNAYSLAMMRLMIAENDNFADIFAEGSEHDIWLHVSAAIEAETDGELVDAGELAAALRALLHGGSHYQCLIGAQTPPEIDALIAEADQAIDIISGCLKT